MMHKHHHGKKGSKNTGVADYFAVLGIDSFLPPPVEEDEEEEDDDHVSEDGGIFCEDAPNDANSAAAAVDPIQSPPSSPNSSFTSGVPSNNNNNGGEDLQLRDRDMINSDNGDNNNEEVTEEDYHENNERSCSGRTVRAGNLSSYEAKTPRNSNRSKRVQHMSSIASSSADNSATIIPEGEEGISIQHQQYQQQQTTNRKRKKKKKKSEEERLHEERFQREIVQLTLVSSSGMQSSSLNSEWTCLNDDDDANNNAVLSIHDNFSRQKNDSVNLAYRLRGENASDNVETGDDDDDENDCHDYNNAQNVTRPQHDGYYTPAVADVSLHYVKVRPSTMPNYHSAYNRQIQSQSYSHHEHNNNPQQQKPTASPTPSSSATSKSSLAHGAARHLSLFARRAGLSGTVAAGKEMATGLAKVVKLRSPVVGDVVGNIINSTKEGKAVEDEFVILPTPLTTTGMATMPQTSKKNYAQPNHLYDTGKEGSFETDITTSQNFEDAHGDVRLWQSNSEMEESDYSDVYSGVNSSIIGGAEVLPIGARSSNVINGSATRSGKREHFFPDTPALPQCSYRSNNSNERRMDGSINNMGGERDEHSVRNDGIVRRPLHQMLSLPDGYDEWTIPNFCQTLHLPTPELVQRRKEEKQLLLGSQNRKPLLLDRTHALPSPAGRSVIGLGRNNSTSGTSISAASFSSGGVDGLGSPSSIGMEAMYLSPANTPREIGERGATTSTAAAPGAFAGKSLESGADSSSTKIWLSHTSIAPDPAYIPTLVSSNGLPTPDNSNNNNNTGKSKATTTTTSSEEEDDDAHIYIPILAVRRQRVGEEERYHEDPAIVEIRLVYSDADGVVPQIVDEDEDDDDDFGNFGRGSTTLMQNAAHPDILKKSPWTPCSSAESSNSHNHHHQAKLPHILLRHNIPVGFADLPFPARVLDRFPQKNYRGMPFPEEELPLFCYAGGSLLVRDTMGNLSGKCPRSFGFVVKNERGDSIYVSCLTFYEPLTKRRKFELDQLSKRRQHTSLPHRGHCQRMLRHSRGGHRSMFDNDHLVAFDDTITFENKTITLVGRYSYWTEFRRFLTHLHLLSGSSSSDIPLERNISHLLLSVPIPKPGLQAVLVPFSTMCNQSPMCLVMPPNKDLPLVDLGYARLFSSLDVPTVVTIVLGFLCLERKVILISTRQSLLLDCCELLKSLLFPFELCAPYVPHLTQPFMSCLEFPGATFVGIHDDEMPEGLAKVVRDSIPEDSIIVELDNGEINCDGDRYETLKAAYQIVPAESRSLLIKEIETLCQDAGIMPGQEPLDYNGVDSAIESNTFPSNMATENFGKHTQHEPLDDRAVRDNFLRFFCSILGGYERFLVVPDADFLTSGNDWFNSSKFLAAASAPTISNSNNNRVPYLSALVETQLFSSFIQRRTEASDVHCVLFDECLSEFHSSAVPYGRLSGDSGSQASSGDGGMSYDLLVDQCATEPDLLLDDDETCGSSFLANRSDTYNKSFGNDNDTATQASSGYAESTISDTPSLLLDKDTPFTLNASLDIVTIPTLAHLPPNTRYTYCVDGNPCFPTKFNRDYFLPKEPEFLSTELESGEPPAPILTRSEREREDAVRLCNMTVSRRGPQKQHRCLWQLAKFMGSQFLGAWLMCIPNQISRPSLSIGTKSKILLRALGALRTLRNRRIVADEAAYRALIVACGRCGTDRRVELMKLYGLMRTDGIFPNAVTLGQYTKAIAEGYSNINVDGCDDNDANKVGMQLVISSDSRMSMKREEGFDLEILANSSLLEESGMKWRSRGGNNASNPIGGGAVQQLQQATANSSILKDDQGQQQPPTISASKTFDTATTQRSTKTKRLWLPVRCSSSFRSESNGNVDNGIRLFALWSRATTCKACSYIPLDEEIQSGWDVIHNKLETSSNVVCPRCAGMLNPVIGYEEMSVDELLEPEADTTPDPQTSDLDVSGVTQDADWYDKLPPQLETSIRDGHVLPCNAAEPTGRSGFVNYLSPQQLRMMLEDLVLEYSDEVILDRDRLHEVHPEIFFNLWWYSARFSLPLPLAVTSSLSSDEEINDSGTTSEKIPEEKNKQNLRNITISETSDCCAFASWDKTVAIQGCRSAAKAITAARSLPHVSSDRRRLLREKLFDNPNTDIPLLSFFNLQSFAQGDWDHPDFSEILVALVKACETRDLLPVVECVFQRNQVRQELEQDTTEPNYSACNSVNASFESAGTVAFSVGASTEATSFSPTSIELDCYRTILYLARYQCTTAFHAFFPTTTRACKGYHFWCAQGTAPLPIFDRAFREAAEAYGKQRKILVPIPEVSDMALGFRSVFGHII